MRRTRAPEREEAYARYRQAVDLPLLVLALCLVPLLLAPVVFDLPPGVDAALTAVDWTIWAVFAADYLMGLVLTPDRRRYLRHEWPNLLLVLLPFLRPLRVVRSARALRLLRLVRVAAALSEATQEARRLVVRHGLHHVLLLTLAVVFGAAGLVFGLESGGTGNIRSFADALWWAATTVTTVGYGDTFPVTAAGRGVAVFLMVTGIAFFGVLTANVAAFVIERDESAHTRGDELAELRSRLDQVLAELAALREDRP